MTTASALDPRLEQIQELLMQLASGHLEARGAPSERGDELDAILAGVNRLAEELTSLVAAERAYSDKADRAREAAEAASRAKSDFLSVLSHELRTPLNAILGFAQLLEMEANTLPPHAARAVGQIGKGGHHLLELIDELLDFARADAGRLTLNAHPLEVADFIQGVGVELMAAAIEKHVHLQIGPLPAGRRVRAEPRHLHRVLRILIGNAIKFTPEDGSVIVEGEARLADNEGAAPANVIQIRVRDTGLGLDPELLPHIFEPFTRHDSSLARSHGGLGLGLALTQRLVELHGGRIWVESQGAGQGSTFSFELPEEA